LPVPNPNLQVPFRILSHINSGTDNYLGKMHPPNAVSFCTPQSPHTNTTGLRYTNMIWYTRNTIST